MASLEAKNVLIGQVTLSDADWDIFERQLKRMQLVFERGFIEALHPDNFPKVPQRIVWMGRYWAYDGLIDNLANMREVTQDQDNQMGLSRMMTQLIQERDEGIRSHLPSEGQIDEKMIRQQSIARQPGEQNDLLRLCLQSGLIEQINTRNFPAFRNLSPKDLILLKRIAAQNRKEELLKMQAKEREIGFKADSRQKPQTTIADEIDQLEDYLSQTAQEYAEADRS